MSEVSPWLKRLFSDTGRLTPSDLLFRCRSGRASRALPLHGRTYMGVGMHREAARKAGDQRSAYASMHKDAVRRRFDVLMVWPTGPAGAGVLHVTNALAELDAADVALYSDKQPIDSTTPMGRAMIQMASVFGEPEREIIRSRIAFASPRSRTPSGGI